MSDLLWLGTAVNSFIDQGKFEAMKMLSDCRASHCDEHQFRAKMTVSILEPFFEISSLKIVVLTRMGNGTFATAHFCI